MKYNTSMYNFCLVCLDCNRIFLIKRTCFKCIIKGYWYTKKLLSTLYMLPNAFHWRGLKDMILVLLTVTDRDSER